MITTMRLDPVNAVSSFHYYMWNAWSVDSNRKVYHDNN